MHTLELFQNDCLRKICRKTVLDMARVTDMRSQCKVTSVQNIVSYRRLRWLGHVARMPDDRLPKILLFASLQGEGVRGAPLKSWRDYVREDLQALKLNLTRYRKAKDRDAWKATIEMLLLRT